MDMDKFDKLWKVSVIVVLLGAFIILAYSLKDFSVQGKQCYNQPFVWGAMKVVATQPNYDSMSCNCRISDSFGKVADMLYSFSDDGENLKSNFNSYPINFNFSGID